MLRIEHTALHVVSGWALPSTPELQSFCRLSSSWNAFLKNIHIKHLKTDTADTGCYQGSEDPLTDFHDPLSSRRWLEIYTCRRRWMEERDKMESTLPQRTGLWYLIAPITVYPKWALGVDPHTYMASALPTEPFPNSGCLFCTSSSSLTYRKGEMCRCIDQKRTEKFSLPESGQNDKHQCQSLGFW